VALGLLILIVVVYFPKGILGYFKDRKQLSNSILSHKGEE
jgi:ABC-type branched-subunit amino acid transport system permease subunit